MADYFQVKNQNIFNPPANTSLGNATNQFSNVYADSTLILGNVSVTGSTIITPRITTITYPGDDTAADPAGGQTITLTGSGFVAGATILINSIPVSVVSVVSFTEITFTSPANSSGSYVMYVINTDGSTAISIPGIQYSGTPTWTTAAGTLGSLYETASFTESVIATGDAPITYSVFSGTLPPGATFNGNGTITGTSQLTASPTTYTFTVRASDAEQQDTDRSFSLTINTDVVTWVTPAAGSTTTLGQDISSTTTLLATSAAGKAITYTANALPTGLSISGATVTGTPTIVGNTASLFTATAATTGRTTTATINWTISVANDPYFMYNSLLLSGGTSTETFIADASVNNFAVTIAGDTKPNNFNPYTPGYYSVYSNNTGVLSNVTTTTISAGVFTFEGWFNLTAVTAVTFLMGLGTNTGGSTPYFNVSLTSSGTVINVECYSTVTSAFIFNANYTWPLNRWVHLAAVGNGTTVKVYVNGVGLTTTLGSGTFPGSYLNTLSLYPWVVGLLFGGGGARSDGVNGYVSNFRFVNGTAVYTADFTPSTTPLTAISGTAMLACQSNRLINSNNVSLTTAGVLTISSFTPFVPNTAYAAYGSTYFDGTGDYLTAPSNSAFGFGNSNYTIELWVYPTSSASSLSMISKGNASSVGADFWSIEFSNTSGGFSFFCGAYNGGSVIVSGTAPLNTWTHIAVVRNSLIHTLYVNGVSVSSATAGADYTVTSAGNLYIGTGSYAPASRTITGYISNARIVKGVAVYTGTFTPPTTPLSATQSAGTNIAAITGTQTSLLTCQTNQPASNSMFLDSSTNAFAVTRAGNTSAGTFSPYGANWSNYFDGTGQSFYNSSFTGANFGTSNFTIEMWVLWTTSAASNQTVIEFTGTRRIIIGRSSTGIRYFNDGTERGYTVTVPVGTWNHIAIVRVSNTTNIYLNGVSGTSFVDNVNWAETQFYVGKNSDGVELTSALYLSNLRVVNGTAVYTGNFAIPTAPLTAISGTTLLICKSNSFIDNSANAFGVTLIGTPSVQRFNPFSPQTQTAISYSGYFAGGATDYLTVTAGSSQLNLPGDFTVELWFNETNTTPTIPQFSGQTSGGFACGINSYDGGGARKLDWRQVAAAPVYGVTAITSNVWHHAAYVKSGSAFRIFLDGVLEYYSGSYSTTFTSTSTYIGTNGSGDTAYAFSGYISNFRVVKGTAVYTTASTTIGATIFAVPTVPLTAIANTALLTCQSPTFVDNSTNALVITSAGTATPRTLNPFGFTNASAAYSAAVYGGSAYFDGTTDYLTTPTNAAFGFGTGDFTCEAWIYRTALVSNSFIMSSSGSGGLFWGWDGNGLMGWGRTGVAWDYVVSSGMVANTWYHVALTRSGTSMKMFVNGTQLGVTQNIATSYDISTTTLNIGSQGANYYFTGYISNARIVKSVAVYTSNFVPPTAPVTAITNTSLLLNMTSAGVYDSASTNNLETVADAKILSTQTPYAGSYYSNYFDGTGDYLSASSNAAFTFGTGAFTIEAWIYPTVYGPTTGNWIYSNISANVGNSEIGLLLLNAGTICLSTWNTAIATSTLTAPLNVWSHVVGSFDGTTYRLFVNGVLSGTSTTVQTLSGTGGAYIGSAGVAGISLFTGYLSNLRIVKGTAVYTGTFTPPTAPLTAIANTSLLTCQSNRFLDNSTYAFTITKNGDTSVQSFNPFQRNSAATMSFDGTGDYLVALYNPAYNFGTGDFTIECWLYQVVFTSDMVITASITTWASSVNFYLGTRAGSPNILIFRAGDAIPISLNGNTGLTTNTWTHVAASRASGVTRMFVNGVTQTATHTGSVNVGTTAQSIGIGAANNASEPINAYINDLRITKGIARYTTTFTPPTTAFLTY